MTTFGEPPVVHLRRGGTSLVLTLPDDGLPVICHWGPDLGADISSAALAGLIAATDRPYSNNVIDVDPVVPILPMPSAGWQGRPGLIGNRAGGQGWSPQWQRATHEISVGAQDSGFRRTPAARAALPPRSQGDQTPHATGTISIRSQAKDDVLNLTAFTELELHPSGLLRVRGGVRNDGAEPYEVGQIEPALPVPDYASELLDMTGRWAKERVPQRTPFNQGAWVRQNRSGRPGHDSPLLLCAGVPGFGFQTGSVWGVHLAWSGDQVHAAEQTASGWRHLRGAEVLGRGEVVLKQGEEYWSPWLVGSWGDGLDQLSARIHANLRARPQHPKPNRPVLLNVWEAVYFEHHQNRLLDLAERAAAIGVERFVLDDGWFLGRRDATAGLGDWYVDPGVWPDGLHPLVDKVHELGMEFGLWFEPEMVNPNSQLAREHPDWLFATEHGNGPTTRHQQVLDLGHPEAYNYVRDRMEALIGAYGVDYVKWDHNRTLNEAGHTPDFRPGIHRHTQAVYRLMAELKAKFPRLEIESCSSGGGRIDLGVLEFCDRVWVSDCNDAHERQRLMRYTTLLLPPELCGAHVGASPDHTTGRQLSLRLRGGTALFGHFGIEWDLAAAPPDEVAELAEWVAFYQQHRDFILSGRLVRADLIDEALLVEGVIAPDQSRALYKVVCRDFPATSPARRLLLPGLDPAREYRVALVGPNAEKQFGAAPVPAWTAGVTLTGAALAHVGLVPPPLKVDDLTLIEATAITAVEAPLRAVTSTGSVRRSKPEMADANLGVEI